MTTPQLTRRAAFEAALQNYHISSAAQRVLNTTPFVLLLAPSAAGRNTIINELLKTSHYHFVISDTTRPPRVNNGQLEQNGVEYFFRTEDEMLAEIQDGRFIEAEIIHQQQVSGTSVRELEKAQKLGKIAITDVDLGGSLAVAQQKKDVKLIFIAPPSFAEWLRRLTTRNQSSADEIKRRLETAVEIFQTVIADHRFLCVINDNLAQAVAEVDAIATTGTIDKTKQQTARRITQQLLEDTQEYLKQN